MGVNSKRGQLIPDTTRRVVPRPPLTPLVRHSDRIATIVRATSLAAPGFAGSTKDPAALGCEIRVTTIGMSIVVET